MFKFYGFSIHEWTAKDRDDGKIGYLDVEVRPQSTIERWDLDVFGTVSGVIQRSPQTQQYHYIPRGKVMHIADDAETDSPEGLGLFRLSVEVGKRIQRYRTLEGFGFETDLRGVPIAGAPIAELQAMVKNKLITLQQAEDLLKPLSEFMSAHIKSPDSGIMVDSSVYTDIGPIRSPSSVKKWTMELLQGGSTGLEAINTAIAREALWLAALYGIEQLFIGGSSRGSQSLSQDKSKNLATQIDADVSSVGRAAERDLIVPLLKMNGIDLKLKPKLEAEKVQWREIEEVTGALQQVAVAGAPLMPDDPAIPQIRALLGLKSPDPKKMAIDATLNRSAMGPKPPPGGGGGPPKPPGANGGFTPPPVAKSDLVLIKR
jgi:hypothetical protein